jgi:glucans biosynthesis protein
MGSGEGPLRGEKEKMTSNPMNQARLMRQLANIRAAPRCGAKTRAGGTCQCPAIRDRKRCRLHGGRGKGAPKGCGNGNYKDGSFTAEAILEGQWLRSIVRTYGKLVKP